MSIAPQIKAKAETQSSGTTFDNFEMAMAYCRISKILSKTPNSKVRLEIDCLDRVLMSDALAHCGGARGVSVVDLGPGCGAKSLRLLERLEVMGAPRVRFIPVDRSPYIPTYATLSALEALGDGLSHLSSLEDGTELETALFLWRAGFPEELVRTLHDKGQSCPSGFFDHGVFTFASSGLEYDFMHDIDVLMKSLEASHRGTQAPRVFCLLGSTISNYPHSQIKRTLQCVARHLRPDDLLLIDAWLRPGTFEIASHNAFVRFMRRAYRAGEGFMRYRADHPGATYRMNYVRAMNRIEFEFERPDGSAQPLGFSYKWRPEELEDVLAAANLEIVERCLSPNIPATLSEPVCALYAARGGAAT